MLAVSANNTFWALRLADQLANESAETHSLDTCGDSGGPVFSWTNSNSQVIPLGIVKSTYMPGGVACKNTSTSPANNTTCFYTFLPLRTIRGYRPFTVNTVNGFLAP